VKRINVSLDTLDPDKFHAITRWGDLDKVLEGIDAAQARRAEDQDQRGGAEGRQRGRDRPDALGARPRHGPDADRDHAAGRDRRRPDRPVSAAVARARAARTSASRWTDILTAPAGRRAMCEVKETGGRLGFITPMTHNFCEELQPRAADLHRHALYVPRPGGCRRSARAAAGLGGRRACSHAAIDEAIARKPKGHDFVIDRRPGGPPSRAT
jgi:GTP 3',8-cyclase